jgi:hypothetical protein
MIPFIGQKNLNATGQTLERSDRWGRFRLFSCFRAIGKSDQDLTPGDEDDVTGDWILSGLNPAIEWDNSGVGRCSLFRMPVNLDRIDLSVAPWLPPSLWAGGIFLRFVPPPAAFLGPIPIFPIILKFQKQDSPKTLPLLRSLKRGEGSLFQGGQVFPNQVPEGLT